MVFGRGQEEALYGAGRRRPSAGMLIMILEINNEGETKAQMWCARPHRGWINRGAGENALR